MLPLQIIQAPVDTLEAIQDSVAVNTSLLHEIRINTLETMRNTTHSFFSDQWCFYAGLVLVVSILTLIPLWTEFKKDRINKKCQQRLFEDLIRHLYRNKVCALTMQIKQRALFLESSKFAYPSEEHYLKMTLLPDDIHAEQFYRDDKKFAPMHNLAFLLRNFNTEIEVAQKHVTDPHILESTIERDFATLNFKPGYITWRIIETMGLDWRDVDGATLTRSIIQQEQQTNKEKNSDQSLWGNEYADEIDRIINAERESNDWYNKLLTRPNHKNDFYDGLRADLLIECGTNAKLSPKIHMVVTDLPKTSTN